jgi:hypothetical protein
MIMTGEKSQRHCRRRVLSAVDMSEEPGYPGPGAGHVTDMPLRLALNLNLALSLRGILVRAGNETDA